MTMPTHEAPRETAATHMVSRIPRATADTLAKTVIQSLQGQKFESAEAVFVTDAMDRLIGIVRMNDLFANDESPIGEIMESEHEPVRYDQDQEQIAMLAMQLNMIVIPVIDDEEKLIGAVPPDAVFNILRSEHMEDLQRLAGIAPHQQGPDVARTGRER
jgi:magnesium transporter